MTNNKHPLYDSFFDDEDATETNEWLGALLSVLEHKGSERASWLLNRLTDLARDHGLYRSHLNTPYINTISTRDEPHYPGDIFIERRIRSLVRWNAMAMVLRANQNDDELGGHIATFASSAMLYDVAMNHFFRAATDEFGGDLVYYQGHSSPGIYAWAYLEGRLTEKQLENFRREVDGEGISSYPHPWLMPDFWQFPTVSMGLGPIQAIYQANIMKYLSNREVVPEDGRKIWAFLGDGEMDEPESIGALSLAGREGLDNLIFVVNCNLQRLDGPVRGNGKIIQELEGLFRGAGWNVIKVVWGGLWDPLLERDTQGILRRRMEECVDGEYQSYKNKGGAYTREHFFGKYPELAKMVEHMSDDEIYALNRGGHDPQKVYAAYHAAVNHKGQPTVILAKTVKGYGTSEGEAANRTHQMKSLDMDSLKYFRDRFGMPFNDEELERLPFYKPDADSPEMRYVDERRKALGGSIPNRRQTSESLNTPPLSFFDTYLADSGERTLSTTMGFVRMFAALVRDKNIGDRLVPIVPDEARTFGMDGLFRQLGIYSSKGQKYEPEDAGQVMYYREDKKGRILEEGINEAGAMSAWMAASTSYSHHNYPLIPFYIYYSMFGFQRVGDLAWASGDIRARGFLLGGTAGRTTLNGEGLQHQDGHSHILSSTIPNCISYDPTYNYELAVILQEGMRRMYQEQEDVFYYITLLNENYTHRAMPEGSQEGILRGLYQLMEQPDTSSNLRVHLLGSGSILREVEVAADKLREDFDIAATVWSAPSFTELRREGLAVERWNRLHPEDEPRKSWVEQHLGNVREPIIAATDYMKSFADQIRPFVASPYVVMGTDGFGRSDTRAKLRDFFEVDSRFVVLAALSALAEQGQVPKSRVSEAIEKYGINPEKPDAAYA